MDFRDERYANALHSVLMASGLQGKLDGRTLLVGTSVSSKTFAPQMSKVFRLNQVDATSALNYLGSLGTKVNVANAKTVTATSREESSAGDDGSSEANGDSAITSSTSESTILGSYGSEVGPLVGLVGTTDARLNTLVLIGDPKLISVAEAYLKQIDLRKRQVAVKVQILNVDLTNEKSFDASFSAKLGDAFIVSDAGRAYMNFGDYRPGASSGTGVFNGEGPLAPGVYERKAKVVDPFDYPKDSVYGYLDAVIESSSAKTLAQPTLLVQEGQEAEVQTGTSVITSVTATDTSNGSTQFKYERENAGLNLNVRVDRIDDNGFVALSINPRISVPISAGKSNGVDIYNISGRSLSSGSIRLRDRQTLVLTGVIQEQDTETATKWPLLGDLPVLGQFFRGSGSSRLKNELVILVTPVIVEDNMGGSYGWLQARYIRCNAAD